ncbi:sigma-E factor negative regulatory protein [Pigmentiphaga soli]
MQVTSRSGTASSFTDGAAGIPEPEWLSGFMDGEAEDPDGELPAFLDTAEGRARWDTYHLIGDVLRTPELAQPMSAAFQQRLAQALAQEPAIIAAPRRSKSRRFMARYGFPGLAAAAAVASVTWVAQPFFGTPSDAPRLAVQAAAPPAGTVAGITPVAATQPAVSNRIDPGFEMSLAEYLEAHRQISGRSAIREISNTSYESQEGQR